MTEPPNDVLTKLGSLPGLDAVFDHAAVAAPRIRDLLPIYRDLLGGVFLRGGDTVRVGYRAVQLGYANGTKFELMEPLQGSRFFDSFFRRGGGLHHVTFKVADLDAAVRRMRVLGYTPTGLFTEIPEWQEVFLHPREANGVLVQLARGNGNFPFPEGAGLEDVLAGRGSHGNGCPSP